MFFFKEKKNNFFYFFLFASLPITKLEIFAFANTQKSKSIFVTSLFGLAISMDSSQQALLTNAKFFFQILNKFLNYWPKTKKYLT